jgi:hypothetical protein
MQLFCASPLGIAQTLVTQEHSARIQNISRLDASSGSARTFAEINAANNRVEAAHTH